METFEKQSGSFDFMFPYGISFPDIIELNFTMTVDPTEVRPVGSGIETAAIAISPLCDLGPKTADPSTTPTFPDTAVTNRTQCGSIEAVVVSTTAPGLC